MRAGIHFLACVAVATSISATTTATPAAAQECKNRGQLDTLYCDDNNDLVADTPTDPRKWKDPATLVFAYTPVEDPPCTSTCTGRSPSISPNASAAA
jgi:phosphonate transport system substrate-binding protein